MRLRRYNFDIRSNLRLLELYFEFMYNIQSGIFYLDIMHVKYLIKSYIFSRLSGQNQWHAMERKMYQIIGDSWKPLAVLPWWVIEGMVFCFQNCSDLLWEEIVLLIKKNFWNSRLKVEKLQNVWRSEELLKQNVFEPVPGGFSDRIY